MELGSEPGHWTHQGFPNGWKRSSRPIADILTHVQQVCLPFFPPLVTVFFVELRGKGAVVQCGGHSSCLCTCSVSWLMAWVRAAICRKILWQTAASGSAGCEHELCLSTNLQNSTRTQGPGCVGTQQHSLVPSRAAAPARGARCHFPGARHMGA